MRTTAFVFALILSIVATPAPAQEWTEYVSTKDGFKINFPGPAEGDGDDLEVANGLHASGACVQRRHGGASIIR